MIRFNFNDLFHDLRAVFHQYKAVTDLFNYPDDFRFDLILYDLTFGPCLLGFVQRFKFPPLVAVSAYNMPPYTSEYSGGHQFYAYIPHMSSPIASNDLDFVERVRNTLLYAFHNVYATDHGRRRMVVL